MHAWLSGTLLISIRQTGKNRERIRWLSENILLDLLNALAWYLIKGSGTVENCWNSMEQSGTMWTVQEQELFSSNQSILLYSCVFFTYFQFLKKCYFIDWDFPELLFVKWLFSLDLVRKPFAPSWQPCEFKICGVVVTISPLKNKQHMSVFVKRLLF